MLNCPTQEDLNTIFICDAETLAANRNGQLTEAQYNALVEQQRRRNRPIFYSGLGVAVLVILIYALIPAVQAAFSIPVLVSGVTFLAVIEGYVWWRGRRIRQDLAQRKVEHIEGHALELRNKRGEMPMYHHLVVKGKWFNISTEVYQALREYTDLRIPNPFPYRVYFEPATRNVIAIEYRERTDPRATTTARVSA